MSINSKEMIFQVIEGEMPDRVPVFPVVDEYHAPKVLNYSTKDCLVNGMKMAKSLLAALRLYNYDGVIATMGPGKDPYKQLGCPVDLESGDVAMYVDNLIKTKEDIGKIKVPNPWSDNKMEPVKHIVKEVGDTHFVIGSIRLPFEIAYIQRGSMNIMTDIYDDPNLILEVIKKTKEITLALGDALIEAGVHGLTVKDSVASASLISPTHYEKFVFPFEREVIRHFKKKVPIILHICRNSAPLLDMMVKTNANVLEVDSLVGLKQAKKKVGDKVVLKGNIDSVGVMERGSSHSIKAVVKKCMGDAKENGNYILSNGDSIPRATPTENVKNLVIFGKKYGAY